VQSVTSGLATACRARGPVAFFHGAAAGNDQDGAGCVKVQSLTVRDFRNIASLDVEFPEDGVVILGANGQGKTNLLEAIYYLVLFRSLRGARDRELVRFGTAGFFVAATAGQRVTAGFSVSRSRKKVTVDGTPAEKLGDAVGRLLAVAFSPHDRAIVTGGPAGRRRFLDIVLSLCDQRYLAQLIAMRAALKQRNAALRRGDSRGAVAFDRPFIAAAVAIAQARCAWVSEWSDRFAEVCGELGEPLQPGLGYHGSGWSPGAGGDELERTLAVSIDRDLRHGSTTVGPHRDDLRLTLGAHDLRAYGSAGQQRTAAVGLRILEAESMARATGRTPVALYDDVFAELDEARQAQLLRLIRTSLPGQSILTAPRESEIPSAMFDRPRWTMTGGRLHAE
jgi:DNA replication and repair protein RecF